MYSDGTHRVQIKEVQDMIKIKKIQTGNCDCVNCGKSAGNNYQPYTLWHKADDEKRGHNEPVCSMECARELAKDYE